MKTFSGNLTAAKNSFNQSDPWLILLDIVLIDPTGVEDDELFYIVRNTENITYNGNPYVALPFEISPTKVSSKGAIPTITLSITNVTRLLQPYIEDFNGGMLSTVKLTVVNNGLLAEDYADLEMDFTVLSCACDEQFIVFTLGAPNPLLQKALLYTYRALHCNWRFGEIECGYGSASGETDTTCERTLAACQAKDNALRFGGQPGMKNGGIRIA
jgi:phage-related protein